MTVVNKGMIVLGIGKQSAKGTIAANPTYIFGVESGGINVTPEHTPIELTAGERARYGAIRTAVEEGADFTTFARVGSVGDFLMGVLGAVTTTGASDPYTHAFTLGATLPWYTIFERLDAVITAVTDCKMDAVEFTWTENKPLMVHVTAGGLTFSLPATFTGTTDEIASGARLTPVGGTFKLDVDSATAATASVKGGSIKFTNANDRGRFSGSLEGGYTDEGLATAEVSLTVRPAADLADWKAMVLTTGGTAVGPGTVAGSFEVKFVDSAGATHHLTFAGLNVDFMYALPEASPDFGPWETDLAGICYMPAAGTSPITATLVNAIASY